MCDTDKTMQDIKSGKGLPPLSSTTNQSTANGISTEQRGYDSGFSFENFTLNQQKKDNNNA